MAHKTRVGFYCVFQKDTVLGMSVSLALFTQSSNRERGFLGAVKKKACH